MDEALTWLESLTRCPEINPAWTSLATIRDEREWQILVTEMEEAWSAPDGPPIGFYNGAWVGLSSPDPIPANVPRRGPWQPGANWQWVDGTSQDGTAITPFMATKWGAVGTGWNGVAQPDNSGGFQRCVLIATGSNALPITADRPFFDDQNCVRSSASNPPARPVRYSHHSAAA